MMVGCQKVDDRFAKFWNFLALLTLELRGDRSILIKQVESRSTADVKALGEIGLEALAIADLRPIDRLLTHHSAERVKISIK
jgi:hypothetical protein